MLEQNTFGTRVTHSLNHRGVVHSVGEKDTTRELGTECRESGIIGDVAGREDESSVLSMEVCEFLFERQMHSTVAGDVTGATSTMTILVKSTTGSGTEMNKVERESSKATYCMVSRTTGLLPIPR